MQTTNEQRHFCNAKNPYNNNFGYDDYKDDDDKTIGTVLDEFVSLLVGDGNLFGSCWMAQFFEHKHDESDNHAQYGNEIRSCDSSITTAVTAETSSSMKPSTMNKYGGGNGARVKNRNHRKQIVRVIMDDDTRHHLFAH